MSVIKSGRLCSHVTLLGDDEFGDILAKHLDVHHVGSHLKRIPEAPTGVCLVLAGAHDRSFVTHYGAARKFSLEDLDVEQLYTMNHVHCAGYYSCQGLAKDMKKLFVALQTRGITISMDTNYDGTKKWSGVEELLPLIDVLLPNEVEARCLARENSVESALANPEPN